MCLLLMCVCVWRIKCKRIGLKSLTHVADKLCLHLRGAGGRERLLLALGGAERFLQAAPRAPGLGSISGVRRARRPPAVAEVAVQQAALVLGGRREAAVAVGGVGPTEEPVVLFVFQGRGPADVTLLADGSLQGTFFI